MSTKITLALSITFLLLLVTFPAYAQEPVDPPDTGYDFEPYELEDVENPVADELAAKMTDVSFLNTVGSSFATLMTILDNFAGGGVLGYFTIFMMGLWVLTWLAAYVFKRRLRNYDPDLVEVKDDTGGNIGKAWSKAGRQMARRKRSF